MERGTPPRCSHEVQVCKIRVIQSGEGGMMKIMNERKEERRERSEVEVEVGG